MQTIEAERDRKAATLTPERVTGVEAGLNEVKEKRLVERLTSGVAGLRARLGGLVTGSGFAVGPEYLRSDFLAGQLTVHASARASTRRYYLLDAGVAFPHLAGDRVFVDLLAVHRSLPRIDYYGPGPDSRRSGRTNFLLEDTSFGGTAGVRPLPKLSVGGFARYLMMNVGPGRDPRFASTDRVYGPAAAPGVRQQTDFANAGGFVALDFRDNPGGPRSGGSYQARYSLFADRGLCAFDFHRLELEAQHYVPFFNERRVIALRARGAFSEGRGGGGVPFYLQTTLGGSDDLRGFRPFRFYDNNALVFNAEYRWEVFSGMDAALFADAGKVYSEWRRIGLHDLEASAGFGLRFNVRNDVFLRIDTGFSHEGFQVWFKFNNVF